MPASAMSTRPSSSAAGSVQNAGHGAMATEINYSSIAPTSTATSGSSLKPSDAFARGGQKLSGKKSKSSSPGPTPASAPPNSTTTFKAPSSSRIINTNDLSNNRPVPQPLRLPFGKLFFGFEI